MSAKSTRGEFKALRRLARSSKSMRRKMRNDVRNGNARFIADARIAPGGSEMSATIHNCDDCGKLLVTQPVIDPTGLPWNMCSDCAWEHGGGEVADKPDMICLIWNTEMRGIE